MNNNNTTMLPSNAIQPRRRIIQNYSLLWLGECMEEATKDYQNILIQLKTITDNVNVFKQRDLCIDYLTYAPEDIKSFLVVKDTVCQQIMPLINDIPQLHGIYILSDTKILPDEFIKKWQKIKSVHTNIDDLCHELQLGIKQQYQDLIAVSFIQIDDMMSTNNLNQLEPTFMYTQIFKDILLNMEHDKQTIKQFTDYCRNNNSVSPIIIDRFENEYQDELAIWWYTFPSNIFSMLNYGLRALNADIIITMGFFLSDLHQQIQQLYEQQIISYGRKSFLVYRGQGLMKSDFEKLQKTKGGLMSFNNFLSTSKDKEVSLEFAQGAAENGDMVGILFIMSIDPCIKSTPFASIKEKSYFKEEDEIIFSMHTVFRVIAIKQMDNKNELYQVELKLTSDDDQQLRILTNRIREEAGGTGWQRLGDLLLKIGQFNKAEELYNALLEQPSDEGEKQHYYNQLGSVHYNQGDYKKAIWYVEQGLEISQKTLSSNHPYLATSYNSLAGVYHKIGEYSKALSSHEKAIEIYQKSLPSNHPNLGTSYNNIGSVYTKMGEYSKALSFYEKALEIRQKTLPSKHPSLAISYSDIGSVYNKIGEYSKALLSLKKAIEIQQKTLRSNHPNLATSYNNIAKVYYNRKVYSKALLFYKKALEIRQKTLPSKHPSLAISYSDIGSAYNKIEEYSKALSSLEKAIEIQQKILPSSHPNLATSYNNIGGVYDNMGEYSKALSFYKKAVKIRQKTLSSNHPHLATSYNGIGSVYYNMGEYSKALLFCEKALEIRQKSLSSSHPDLATSYDNIGRTYDKMGEYSKALSSHEKALKIREKTLPSNHPDLATTYNSIGFVYSNMEEYSESLLYYEKALEIYRKSLASNHSPLATS
ncbi:unnamed protein product [Adineta steineri]|uniref:NAD(P)(+)--arginine ADP-ribosyltransferase n=2 Tax=Adineta steineri TaxID=433720 RepID=A0A815LDL9_9BILA|nr:unnamed protein product [Adineta steineri]